MSKSRLPIDEIIKSAGSLTSAISLLGFQHLSRVLSSNQTTESDRTKAADVRKFPISDRFTPRCVIREIMGVTWHAIELAQHFTSGLDTLFLQEFQNKLEAFSLFEHVDYALGLGSSSSLSLSQLVARAATLDPYICVWATEGIGHYFADRYLADHNDPHALMLCP